MGVDGLSVPGEQALPRTSSPTAFRTWCGAERQRYAGKRTLVVGGGHSAINVALALMELQQEEPRTEIFWALRRDSIDRLLGGGLNDELPETGRARARRQGGRWTMAG